MCDNEAVTHRMRALDLSSDHQRELRANVLLNYRFYVNYRTTAANDTYPDLSPAKRRWDKLRQYESTVTLLQQLAQSLRSDVEEAKAKQNYATERVTAAEEELRPLSEGGAGRPSRADAPHVGGSADAAGHGVELRLSGRRTTLVPRATTANPARSARGAQLPTTPRIAAGPPSTTLSAAGRGRRGPHTSQQGAHTSEPANSTVTAEPPASAATPEQGGGRNAASKLLVTANAALDKLMA